MYSDDEFDATFVKTGKTFVDVPLAANWQLPERVVRVRIADVVKYYYGDARNISSGIRSIAGVHGDWRMIDYIAGDVLSYFKRANREGLKRESRKYGMTLRGI